MPRGGWQKTKKTKDARHWCNEYILRLAKEEAGIQNTEAGLSGFWLSPASQAINYSAEEISLAP